MSTPTEDPTQKPEKPNPSGFVLSDTAANIIIGVVTTVWALNIIAGMVKFNDYQPSEYVHGIFMVIVGGAFGIRLKGQS